MVSLVVRNIGEKKVMKRRRPFFVGEDPASDRKEVKGKLESVDGSSQEQRTDLLDAARTLRARYTLPSASEFLSSCAPRATKRARSDDLDLCPTT